MKFPSGTIARNNRTDEKYVLDHEVEALQEDRKGLVWRIQDSRGDYIFIKDNEEPRESKIIGGVEYVPLSMEEILNIDVGNLKNPKRVTKFSRYRR